MNTRLMNALQQVFEHMDVAPGDVYWRYDGVEFSLGRDWEVIVDDYHDPAGDVDNGFYVVTVTRTNQLGQAIDHAFEVTDKCGNTFVLRGSLLCSIEACRRRINDRLAKSEDAL